MQPLRSLEYARVLAARSICSTIRVVILLGLSLGVAGLPAASEVGRQVTGVAKETFVQTWSERLQALQSLHMVFTQVKHLRQLRQPLRASGELWLKGETLLYTLQDAAGETELAMRLEPGGAKMYYPQLQTLEVFDFDAAQAPDAMMPFLTREPAALLRHYDSTLFTASGLYTLILVPKDPASLLAELRFTLEDFRPREFQQVEKSGNRLVMHISTFAPNVEVSVTQLELHVPEGTSVTRPVQ